MLHPLPRLRFNLAIELMISYYESYQDFVYGLFYIIYINILLNISF